MSPCCRDWYLHNICSLLEKKKSERSNSVIKYGSPPLAPDCGAVCFIVLFHFHLSGLWLMWPWFYCAVVRNKTKASLIHQDLPPVGSPCTCMYMCVYRWSKTTCSRLTECAKLCKTADILLIFPVQYDITSKQRGTGILYLQSPKILNDFEYIASC